MSKLAYTLAFALALLLPPAVEVGMEMARPPQKGLESASTKGLDREEVSDGVSEQLRGDEIRAGLDGSNDGTDDSSDRNGNNPVARQGDQVSDRSGWVRGEATHYHPSLAGNLMADNKTEYWPDQSGVVAATGWPLFTILYVCGPTGRCLTVEVRDTGLFPKTDLDFSEADQMMLCGYLGRCPIQIGEEK